MFLFISFREGLVKDSVGQMVPTTKNSVGLCSYLLML